MYGYGDEETWPACYGHPNDPRTPDTSELDSMAIENKRLRDELAEAEMIVGDLQSELAETRNELRTALERAADAMRRADPAYCEAHNVAQVSDDEWDEAVQAVEDAIEALIGNAGAIH